MDGRLAGRVCIPVHDARGVLRSYTARSYVGHDKRYLEPKRTEGPDLNAVFGENYWPRQPGLRQVVIVGEGALNCVALERVLTTPGLKGLPLGALMGSHISAIQVAKVATFQAAVIMTDNDMAGDRAAGELDYALGRHMRLVRAVLPKGTDPDVLAGTPEGVRYLQSEVARCLALVE